MSFYFFPVILCLIMAMLLARYGYGLRYIVFCSLILQATPLLALPFFMLSPKHFFGLLAIAWVLKNSVPLSSRTILGTIVVFSPFILSLIYNMFFFEPVYGWAWEGEDRLGYSKVILKESLDQNNFTQLMYLAFALLGTVYFASVTLDRAKIVRLLEWMMFTVSVIALIQLIAFFTGFHEAFKLIFHQIETGADQLFLWGMKRLTSTFIEPSYFGYFLFLSLSMYLILVGHQVFQRSKLVWFVVAVGFLSTATTFIWGFFVIIMFIYFKLAGDREKMLYFILLVFLTPIIVYFGYDLVMDIISTKQGSTNERSQFSWDFGWDHFFVSPFFGVAYATNRSLFIYTQLLGSVGLIGTAIFLYGLTILCATWEAKLFMLMCLVFGIATFEVPLPEMWFMLGILANRNIGHRLSPYSRNTERM